MKRYNVINRLMGATVVILMVTLFYLIQRSYSQLKESNQTVIKTNNVISAYQYVANDFKNAVIYISTYKNSPSQDYVHTYGKGLWELQFHVLRLKRLLNNQERAKVDAFSIQMSLEENWLEGANPEDIDLHEDRDRHMKSIVSIQRYFDTTILKLQHQGIEDMKISESSLSHLNYWIDVLIISSISLMILASMLVYKQFTKLKEIAWIQSHLVRAQVANLLGLGQLLNLEEPADMDNTIVLANMLVTSHKLDKIVRDINIKAS